MRFRLAHVMAVLVTATTLVTAGQGDSARVLFEAARKAEVVDGDLKAAIEQYRKVAQGSDRALAARALVRMAESYEKLGDAEARTIYARIVREFPDRKEEVALASARLGRRSTASSAGMTFGKVWSVQKGGYEVGEGSVSRDGRYISFPDYETGNLMLHDVVTGHDRPLTNTGYTAAQGNVAAFSAISRDGRRIAYGWDNGIEKRYELRVVALSDGFPSPRTLFHNGDVRFLVPFDWSPDGQWIAVGFQRNDRTFQLGLISASDGTLRVLKTVAWRGATRMSFSPDGKYLAFDLPTSDTDINERDVFAMAVNASAESHVVNNPGFDSLVGWSPDGAWLLFASERTETLGLWGIQVADGRAQGTPTLIKPDIPPSTIGVTTSGDLFTVAGIGGMDIKTAALDLDTGRLLTPPASTVRLVRDSRTPDWSPDGKSLAYLSERDRALTIVIRAVDTGEVREVRVDMDYIGVLRWAPDSQSFVGQGNVRGQTGVYRIDARTGSSTPLHLTPGTGLSMAQLSPDGKKLYFWGGGVFRGGEGSLFVERDLASGSERVVFRGPGPAFPALSPDGRFLSGTAYDERSRSSALLLIPVADGPAKELLRVSDPQTLDRYTSWTPDGRGVIVPLQSPTANHELRLVPIDGSASRKLDVDTRDLGRGGVRIHPDGEQITWSTAGDRVSEVWVLENFLPALPAKK